MVILASFAACYYLRTPPVDIAKPAPTTSKPEQVANKNGAGTFADPKSGSGQTGIDIPPYAIVQGSCKIYAPTISSSKPDGYWYRIASIPWNNNFYAVANLFANRDPLAGPYNHNTDFTVPDC